ncbi:selenocysteine-specific translation elongation factor [Clostridium fallax]|uniref:Selenocysteine-specific elongation factor n=1 Tax=Clostridium fallax TaxID=1533 RepID=A0A1M4V9B4_9CLOT|nr:selenocysteine-specific translation elongation factor [Clostridium fallax]SHE65586.1 selenocysteine-specific elongation factor [Clostridium fallax]SQB05830.1 selenocysteine-specific translation elongation factor [Clostridium fallax]
MKHVIIGTAGHIDHGKTTLIRALTGRETDTLEEEKKRGISINLGFTYFDLPSGKRAGIIDVPGHEKFIKNMLAGVSTVDVVLLVIAADEGVMPQTKEHLEILSLLNVKKGIVVLTKKDMVDEEWLEMITEDVKEKLKGTFLENAPLVQVSAKNKDGIKALIDEIEKATDEVESKDREGHFRLPVDRVFTISGFGTVVTGTIISGRVSVGDTIEVYPETIQGKVRNIQVHEEDKPFAEAGQRSAINLSNIKKEDIKRGDIIATPNIMEPSYIIDCSFKYLSSQSKNLENRQRVRVYHGTKEIIGRVILLSDEELKPGDESYIQLRLEDTITAQRGDRIVIRNYSPMETIGGGVIIEPVGKKVKRFDEEYIKELKIKEKGSAEDIIEKVLEGISGSFPDSKEILKSLGRKEEKLEEYLGVLLKDRKIINLVSLDKPVYIHSKFFMNKGDEIVKLLEGYHKANPLKVGMSKEEIKSKVFGPKLKGKNYDEILKILEEKGEIKIKGSFIAKNDFQVNFTKEQERIKNKILKTYEEGKYQTPKYEDIIKDEKDKGAFKMVYQYLLDGEDIIKTVDDCFFSKNNYLKAKELVIEYINKNGSITAGEARDLFNTSRKYAVAILESFDNIKLTKRVEDKRILA